MLINKNIHKQSVSSFVNFCKTLFNILESNPLAFMIVLLSTFLWLGFYAKSNIKGLLFGVLCKSGFYYL